MIEVLGLEMRANAAQHASELPPGVERRITAGWLKVTIPFIGIRSTDFFGCMVSDCKLTSPPPSFCASTFVLWTTTVTAKPLVRAVNKSQAYVRYVALREMETANATVIVSVALILSALRTSLVL